MSRDQLRHDLRVERLRQSNSRDFSGHQEKSLAFGDSLKQACSGVFLQTR